MEELKQEATELGLDFKGNISKSDLTQLIEDAKNQTIDGSVDLLKKVKVRINPRDPEEKEGWCGWSDFSAQFQFDEVIGLPLGAVEFLKSKGSYKHDGKGGKKWLSRFMIEMV
jgi:hypothetical protein